MVVIIIACDSQDDVSDLSHKAHATETCNDMGPAFPLVSHQP